MNYRIATILAEKSLGTKTTETIPLNVQDPISRIEIGWRPRLLNNAMLAALAVGISKVELIDGSDVLHSLSGRQNQALCLYDRRVPTMNDGNLISGSYQYATLGIDFGRFLYDPELAFDPTKFRNPQLKITHDSTLLGADTSTHSLEVFAHLFDERAISPVGFLTAREHFVWTPSGNNVTQEADLPTDMPIRQILLQPYFTGKAPTSVVDYFKLSEDNDKRIPLDLELTSYCKRMRGSWKTLEEVISDYVDSGGSYDKYVAPTSEFTVVSGLPHTGMTVTLDTYVNGGFVRLISNNTAMLVAIAHGYLPHHCIQFPFGRQDMIDDWYDVTRVGSLKAKMVSATTETTALVGLILQQLRRY